MFGFFNKRKSIIDSSLLQGAVDNHSHILYGLDDGVKKVEESLTILEFLEKQGLDTLWFTPHTMEDVPNNADTIGNRFNELKAVYKGNIKLKFASEYMLDNLFLERLEQRNLLFHGQDRVLVETSIWAPPLDFWNILDKMMRYGYRPLVAHPERYRYLKSEDYAKLHNMGCLLQLNLPSIIGVYGEETMNKAHYILDKGWYCMFGSDCHRFNAIRVQDDSKVLKADTIKKLENLKTGLED